MKLPGYQRKGPDPISPGVMAATPRTWLPDPLPRPRWRLRCWLRGHLPFEHRLRNSGERWTIVASTCKRCHVLLDANARTRVTRNK